MGVAFTCVGERAGAIIPCASARFDPPPGWSKAAAVKDWCGMTVPEWIWDDKRPDSSKGAHWCRGDGTSFQVRSGPNYASNGSKTASVDSLYDCISVDIVKSDKPVYEVLGRLIAPPSQNPARLGRWTPQCGLPRILCVVTMFPYGLSWTTKDPEEDFGADAPGCSVVTLHSITDSTVKAAMSDDPPAAVRLFREFVRDGASGKCKLGDTGSSGVLKGIAYCDNPDDIGVSSLMMPLVRSYNGKPALITRSGRIFKDPKDEWMEVDIDIRVFSYAARSALYNLQGCLPLASVHIGFTIQGCEDEELPEGIVCCCRVHNFDLVQSPAHIKDPRNGSSPAPIGGVVPGF